MTVFLDTSALIKLYHAERGSIELRRRLVGAPRILIAELSKAEIAAASWRKARSTQASEFTSADALLLQQGFENDIDRYTVVPMHPAWLESCRRLINRCNSAGYPLRTLDAIHLRSVLQFEDLLEDFITFDGDLKSAARFCGLHVPDL